MTPLETFAGRAHHTKFDFLVPTVEPITTVELATSKDMENNALRSNMWRLSDEDEKENGKPFFNSFTSM